MFVKSDVNPHVTQVALLLLLGKLCEIVFEVWITLVI